MLKFHNNTRSPFLVNVYSYFSYNAAMLNYAMFCPNAGVYDPAMKINYKTC